MTTWTPSTRSRPAEARGRRPLVRWFHIWYHSERWPVSKCDKLLRQAQQSPSSLRFEGLCYLAQCYGFVPARQEGSHRVFKHPTFKRIMDFQPDKSGKAKPYQVRQLLDAIEEGASRDSGEDKENEDDA